MTSRTISINSVAYKALKKASSDLELPMSEIASEMMKDSLSEYVEPEGTHESQVDIMDLIESTEEDDNVG